MNVLVACECSQIVTDAFRRYGNQAISCDLQPAQHGEYHYQGDCFDLIDNPGSVVKLQDGSLFCVPYFDLMVAHPPCTYLSSAGLYLTQSKFDLDGSRKRQRDLALDFFKRLDTCYIPHKCLENPRGYVDKHYRSADQELNPYQFGDAFTKRTRLWLTRLPLLLGDDYVQPESFILVGNRQINPFFFKSRGLSKLNRQKVRSQFWYGIADCMARSWCEELLVFY